MRVLLLSLSLLLASCSSATPGEPGDPATGQSIAELCAGAPRLNGDGTATTAPCLFEQQMVNATHYGHAVSSRTLVDNDGTQLATVARTCSSWYIGADTEGVGVAIDGDTGQVRSHGMFHAGNLTSSLPERVVTPLAFY